MTELRRLFSGFQIKDVTLKNRVTVAPMYVGYANPDGSVSDLTLDHYREMAASGAAMVVVEHTAVDSSGLGSPFMLRIDDDRYLPGMSRLAETIRHEGAVAFLQINHVGRYAFTPERWAPSPYPTGGVIPGEMSISQIDHLVDAYGKAARRVKDAGFDGVEVHGGMGYLLAQFLSPRTNQRTDNYGGSLGNRMRFPLRVVERVMATVGDKFPVGYRFMADEEQPEGLHPEESTVYAKELARCGIAYLSVIAGTHDAYSFPEFIRKTREEGFMAGWAEIIKRAVPDTPVITAGRIHSPDLAERILSEGKADLIALARVLFADPLWPKKAAGIVAGEIVHCEPRCSLCSKRAQSGKPLYCSQWPKARRVAFLTRVGERPDEADPS